MNQAIEVTVDIAGGVTVRTVGFSGPTCREASRAIERALGVVASDDLTAEYFQVRAAEPPRLRTTGD